MKALTSTCGVYAQSRRGFRGFASKSSKLKLQSGVHIVDTVARAEAAVAVMRASPPSTRYACDTEVTDIDLQKQSPVHNGKVTCVSLYAGNKLNFGDGSIVWVDNLDGEKGTLEVFKDFFEDEKAKKVWHNYSFDRHVMYNHGINVQGLGGDTMHMARLWDTSRGSTKGSGVKGGYSLAELTTDLIPDAPKVTMKQLFSKPVLKKDGTLGKKLDMASIDEIQRDQDLREDWIQYSCYDAQATYNIYQILRSKLLAIDWAGHGTNLFDFYTKNLVPFGELLTDIEREGFQIDHKDYLTAIKIQALKDREENINKFIEWTVECGAFDIKSDALRLNTSSSAQKQRLLFASDGKLFPDPALVEKIEGKLERAKSEAEQMAAQLELEALQPKEALIKVENTEGIVEVGKKKPTKYREISVKGLGLPPTKYTPTGWPAVGADTIKELAGDPFSDPPKYGTVYEALGGGEKGDAASKALYALKTAKAIETLLATFITPLQEMVDVNGRIHCSLNLNTETGRLSSRRPNLQNQPALEKDTYKIRDAFVARDGNTLIVADYGQLELRVLAHMAHCESMLVAFKEGGDFHSRTAMGMYDYIAEAEKNGEVVLEWDAELHGKPAPVPLIKDVYASERRKAKILNFSIAYGKTPVGLAKDWGVSVREAKETVNRWYRDRPEVRTWQEKQINQARSTGSVRTIWGRYRQLPLIRSANQSERGRAERAAINTPIQGSAADIVMAAMLQIHKHKRLKQLGWKMVLQVHDEIILEGPKESAVEAQEIVLQLMKFPFDGKGLIVDLSVDSHVEDSWYKAK